MKKYLPFLLVMLLTTITAYNQAPGIFNYQGVARNSVGNVLQNKTITLRLTIHDGSATGTAVYQESRSVTTNPFGLFNVQVGSPGASNVTGTITAVNWALGNKYIQVEIDPAGGSSFINIGTAQLASVPYAMNAAGAFPIGPAGGSLTGNYPNPLVANAAIIQQMIAPGVTLPPSGPAGGSLTGNYPNPLVANSAIIQSMIAPGVTLPPNGPAGGSLSGNYPNPLVANGAIIQSMIAVGVTLPPNGPAGGSLTGNYPNPSVANGAITQSMIAPGVSLPPSGLAGGDLGNTYPNPTVTKLRGINISATPPALNSVLGFDGTNWSPVILPSNASPWVANGNHVYNSNSGNVGIGTNSPIYKLTVHNHGEGFLHTNGIISIGTYVGAGGGWLGTYSDHPLYFTTNIGSQQMTLLQNGNFGIGTINPASRLHIIGNSETVRLGGNSPYMSFYNGANYSGFLGMEGNDLEMGVPSGNINGNLVFYTQGNARMIVRNNGNVQINSNNEALRLNGTDPYLSLFNGGNYKGYLWSKSSGDIELGTAIGNTNSLILSNDGFPTVTINKGSTSIRGSLEFRRYSGSQIGWWAFAYSEGFNHLVVRFNGGTKATVDDVDGDWIPFSDRRLKENFESYRSVLDGIKKLDVQTYHYKADKTGRRSFGLVAQNVQQYFPEIVSIGGPDGLLGIAYAKTGVLAIKAIQEQQIIIESQQKRIEALEKRLAALEARLK